MIMGMYPCCEGVLVLEYTNHGFMKEECPHCGVTVWHEMSNFVPCSWTEEQFLKQYNVCEEPYKITKK